MIYRYSLLPTQEIPRWSRQRFHVRNLVIRRVHRILSFRTLFYSMFYEGDNGVEPLRFYMYLYNLRNKCVLEMVPAQSNTFERRGYFGLYLHPVTYN